MSPKEREAEEAANAYRVALARLGVQTTAEAITLWDHVPPGAKAGVVASWLDAAVQLIMGRRTQSVALARAYYRLVRALSTGRTVADPNHPDPENITLGDLRREFNQLAATTGSLAHPALTPSQGSGKPGNASPAQPQPQENDTSVSAQEDDDERVIVEELERLAELEAEQERLAEQEIREALQTLGPNHQVRLLGDIDPQAPVGQVDQRRNVAHDTAGARQAAAAARIAMNGARSTVWLMHDNDTRCIGYVRISTTGTPCGWCAMLISRGPVYRTERSGSLAYDDGDKFHDNCYCIAVPIFSRDWYGSSPMFDLNRRYAELWPKVTEGLGSGKEALAAWRRFIRTEQAAA